MKRRNASFILFGALLGGIIGFLLRPSAPFIGQLPWEVVLTRGNNLTGMDKMLVPLAETSGNYVFVGFIIGAVLGAVVAEIVPNKEKEKEKA